MKRNIFFSLFLLPCLVACQAPEVAEYQVIPEPQMVAYTSGVITLSDKPTIGYPDALQGEATLLQSYLVADFALAPELQVGKEKADIVLLLDAAVLPEQKEGYVMDVAPGSVVIKSSTPAGVLNGVQTLRQTIRKEDGKFVVQEANVTDYPAFGWRAFMLDEGRYFKGKEVVMRLLDEMALLKMNVFHWHLTEDQGWRIEIKKYPKLTEVGAHRDSSEIKHFESNVYDGKPHSGFYTQEEIKEIVAYAAARHIMIVPEIEMPGHASAAIAAYPWLGTTNKQIKVPGKFGVHYEVYNVADPRVTQFLEDVMDEVIALFPAPVFHIGGDEVKYNQWKASPAIRSYMAKNKLKTPAELQIFFTNNISNILASKDRRMMGWNEITGEKLHEYQSTEDTDVSQKLADGTIIHFWKGDIESVKRAIEKGYDVVNSYQKYTYLDYSYESIPLDSAYAFNPIPVGLPAEMQSKVLGLGCQMWGEFIPTVESMNAKVYPRLAAYAESGWTSPDKKDYARFMKALPFFLNRWTAEGIVYEPIK